MSDLCILVQPMYSKQELNADSNYVVYTELIRAMAKVRPDWHWVVIFPDASSGYKYESDGFFSLPTVSRVPQQISPRKMGNAISFDSTWYDGLMRKIAFDLLWCNLVEVAPQLALAGEASFEEKGRPIVVAAHNYPIHESLPYPFGRMAHVAWAQVGGAMFANWNVWNSDHCRQMWMDTAKKWVHPSIIDDVLAKSCKINYGTLDASIKYSPPSQQVPIIAYNHRLQGYKNYKETFSLLDELYREGVKFKVRYMNNSAERTSEIMKYPFVEIKLSATHAEYLQHLRECDLNVTNSMHESFCIAGIESMAYGQPLIAPDGITFPEITGRASTRYPYLFKSRDEQKKMIRTLLQSREERRKWGKILSAHVRKNYNSTLWAEQYAALFERLTDFKLGVPGDVREWAAGILRSVSGAALNDVSNSIVDKRFKNRIPFGNQALPHTKLIRLARELGGRVRIEKGVQRIYLD